jgi:glycosyltransferase involved in cell wall biosynthesis
MGGIFVREQVDSLRKRGLDIDVLFVNGVEEGKAAYLRGFGQVREAVGRGRYDLIHAHYVFSGMMALGQAVPFAPGGRLPIVLTQHGIETQRGWTAPLCRWTSRRVDRTIATSPVVQAALGLPGVDIVPCGVDTDLFAPADQAEARAALGLPQGPRLALFAGMRRPEKRLDLIETAVAEAARLAAATGGPEIRLIIADNEPHERIPLYMNACDALVLASEGEGSPMVVKEAMACNLPVISVDVGDVQRVIGGTAGCYVVAREVSALAEAICAALTAGRRTEGRAAIMPLSLDGIAVRIESIYRETLRARAA